MLCDECGIRKATVHMAKIIQGKKEEIHLCEQCASKKEEWYFDNTFSINNFLAELLDINHDPHVGFKLNERIYCDQCGMTYNRFKQIGRLGCPHCYEIFKDKLTPLIRRIHGNTRHMGKIPRRCGGTIHIKREIKQLKRKLQEAIETEAYERAAELRDRIRELEEQIQKM